MELVANVWPVHDESGLVLRYLIRAYAIEASDEVISATLGVLAEADFLMGRTFAIPKTLSVSSEHGTIVGCVLATEFSQYQGIIFEGALKELEKDYAKLQGVMPDPEGRPKAVNIMPRFPDNPYVVTTPLLEDPYGNLTPVTRTRRS